MSLDVNISEPEEFNHVQLHSFIEEIATMNSIADFQYHVDYLSDKGENYTANVFRVTVSDDRDNKDGKQISVIVKTLINTARQELFYEFHKREVDTYNLILPKFQDLQTRQIIDENLKLKIPNCYISSAHKGKQVLILEDLNKVCFEFQPKAKFFESFHYDLIYLVLSDLAKFHALSFIFQNKEPEEFERISHNFIDITFEDEVLNKSKLKSYYQESFKTAVTFVKDVNCRRKLEIIETKLIETLKQLHKPGKYNVLCHGDCWMNNILIKYKECKPSKCCFIDFQALRYASPATDILYFVFLMTDSKFRVKHFIDLQAVYYSSLKSYLELYELDVNDFYGIDNFKQDLQDYLPLGLLMSLVELRIVTTTPEHDATLKGSGIIGNERIGEVPGEVKLFEMRVNDLVEEFAENGILDRLA